MAGAVFPPYLAWGQYCGPTPKLLAWDSRTLRANLARCLVGILLLSPGSCCTQSFVCALQESVSPVLWRFCNHIPLASMSPGVHKVLFEPSNCLWQVWGLFLNMILRLVQSCWGFSFALGCGVSFFFGGIQHSLVHGCSAESCNFGVLSGEDELRSLYFTIPLEDLGHILIDAQGWVAALSVQEMSTSSSVSMFRAPSLHLGPSRSSCSSFLSHTLADMVPYGPFPMCWPLAAHLATPSGTEKRRAGYSSATLSS